MGNLKLVIQELKTKFDIISSRLDQEEKKVTDLVSENVNLKLSNQEVKARLDLASQRLDQEEQKSNHLVSENFNLKADLLKL